MVAGGGRFLARGRRAQRVEVEARHVSEWERDTTQRRFDPLRGWPAYMANTRLPSYGEGLAHATMEMAILPHKACASSQFLMPWVARHQLGVGFHLAREHFS